MLNVKDFCRQTKPKTEKQIGQKQYICPLVIDTWA